MRKHSVQTLLWFVILLVVLRCENSPRLKISKGDRVILIGNNLGSRMMNFGYFETEMQLRYPDSLLFIRNMCDGGNTPGFRPHSGRISPWAFPGAEKFQSELATSSGSEGHFETEDEWLTRLKADFIIAFFGSNESFQGSAGIERYKQELDAFIKHTQLQKYNGIEAPQLVLVSPTAFEDLSGNMALPNGEEENKNLAMYTSAMAEVAAQNNVYFVDAYAPFLEWLDDSDEPLTIDGLQLNEEGYKRFSKFLVDEIFGESAPVAGRNREWVHSAVMEKNWMWHNDFKIPNGVHVFGRRYEPFGPDNYPAELVKIREMTAIRDTAIWRAAQGMEFDVAGADQRTTSLPNVETNYNPERNGSLTYLYGQEALSKLVVPPGFKIELFASEEEFADLANPVQMSFDNQGRLWIATMPSYPHYKPGDAKPNDKLIILEDTDGDGRADKQTTYADGLHLPLGFELAAEGVYLSQGTNMVLLSDNDGDGKADTKEIILSGFDDHDTHHAHHAYTADPSGAIYMGEGVFLHTNVETPYGPVRGTNGGFYRYDTRTRRLERAAQLQIPNPWGIAFDEWGQNFFAETSSPDVRWMMPGSVRPLYGVASDKSINLIEEAHRVRPTSGLEFVSSRHFPDQMQGDLLINNTIGFLGTKQHTLVDNGTGYQSRHRQDLVRSTDLNFRPVDMEFAPDGSLYIIDWHNILIGHMQHNARDPLRDHAHGRVYRVTYPSRPLVKPANVAQADVAELLENLTLPEYRTRYRSRRELRGRNSEEVLRALRKWISELDNDDPRYEHHLLEGLWVSWGLNKPDTALLRTILRADDYRVRAAGVRALRYNVKHVRNYETLFMAAAADDHGRVRLEAIVAASWLSKDFGLKVLAEASKKPLDEWMANAYEESKAHLNGESVQEKNDEMLVSNLKGRERELFIKGKEIYAKEGFCGTCHQADGKGLSASGFPPIAGTPWVLNDDERLIKIVLKGLQGPIEVLGKQYAGQVPMTPFEGLLDDEEVASVLTYVRNSFGNTAPAVYPEKVRQVRATITNKNDIYSSSELLKEHPLM